MDDPNHITDIPDRFQVAVLLNRKPSTNQWLRYSWAVKGLVVSSQDLAKQARGECVRTDPDEGEDYLWGGLTLRLYKDQVESYYYNLLAPQPCLYIILRPQDQHELQPGAPKPVRVSASFDEANAYVESDDDAQPVPMPAEIYPWVEQFVLAHYVPERPKKRKRQNWKEQR